MHDDYVTSITQLAQYQNTYQFISTGETFAARLDIRKGVLEKSEDQEDEILCSCVSYPSSFEYDPYNVSSDHSMPHPLDTNRNGGKNKRVQVTAVMGMATGVLTFWTKDNWSDQQNRAILSTDSIDCIAEYPGEKVLAGSADGLMRLVDVKRRKSIKLFEHGGDDGVVSVASDAWGRVVSAGGETVKVWDVDEEVENKSYKDSDTSEEEKDSDEADTDDSDSDDDKKKKKKTKKRKRGKAKQRLAQLSAKRPSVKPNFSGLD